jgi:hypothetical protein
MNEFKIIVEALQFLLGQHVNEIDPVAANAASRHLGNVKSLAAKALAPVESEGLAPVKSEVEAAVAKCVEESAAPAK